MRIYVKPPYQPEIALDISEITAMINNGSLSLDSLGWREGMTEWAALRNFAELNILQEKTKPTPPPVPASDLSTKRKNMPVSNVNTYSDSSFPSSSAKSYGGIRRTPYVLIMLGLIFLHILLSAFLGDQKTSESQLISSFSQLIFLFIAPFFPVYFRLKNIGQNPWWCLLLFLPVINAVVMVRGIIYQEGYQETKKIDKKGKVCLWIVFGTIGLVALLMLLAIITSSTK